MNYTPISDLVLHKTPVKKVVATVLIALFLGIGAAYGWQRVSPPREVIVSTPTTVPTQVVSPTPIIPTPSSVPPLDLRIDQTDGTLQQCLEQANKEYSAWRAGCTGPNCEGADMIDDPRHKCYEKYASIPSDSFLVGKDGQCPSGYIKSCRPGLCLCQRPTNATTD